MQDLESLGAQPLEGRADERLVALSVFQVPCRTSSLHRAPALEEVT